MEDEIAATRPSTELIQGTDPKIQVYILELEDKLKKYADLEKSHKELDTKYIDVQEDLFGVQIRIHELLSQTKELNKLNEQLRNKNADLMEKNKKLEATIDQLDRGRALNHVDADDESSQTNTNTIKQNAQQAISSSNTNNANSVLVKNLPRAQMDSDDYKKTIIKLGKIMEIKLSKTDVKRTTIKERKFYERQNMQPDKIILIVEFNNQELKVDFLKHKERLKTNDSAKNIEITDFVSEEVYDLYQFAKVLKSQYGYNSVYWRNNCVYAKETRSSEPIHIKSQTHVNVLKKSK